ncbi:MAG: class I SAM-dependent methyltransferase [Rubrivivax sp.]|nr:class I SAM-dependent methyltransferase [Rubrivivax sp.]
MQRFTPLILPGGAVLDVACGSGRHLAWLLQQGRVPTGVDRDAAALAPWQGRAEVLVADLEAALWPLPGRRFDAVLVTNYLWRPLWPALRDALTEGGVLIVETFAHGQQTIGKPSRPEFLLQPGELLAAFAGLRVVAFEDGFEDTAAGLGSAPSARFVQRLCAVRQAATSANSPLPPRYGLQRVGS